MKHLPALLIFFAIILLAGCAAGPDPATVPGSSPEQTVPVSSSVPSSFAPAPSDPSSEAGAEWILAGSPVKTLYLEGESFEPVGLSLRSSADGSILPPTELLLPEEPLRAGQTEVVLSYAGERFSCPVTVLAGTAGTFASRVSAEQEEAAVRAMTDASRAQATDLSASPEPFTVGRALDDPCPGGTVRSREELARYVDYHAFYGISSVVLRFGYPVSDPEEELNDLYLRSAFLAGNAAVQIREAADGVFQLLIRTYEGPLYAPASSVKTSRVVSPARKISGRTGFSSPKVSEDGITVYTSDQAVYALLQGETIAPVPGSPAEKAVRRAEEILTAYADDGWNDTEKLVCIFCYFTDRCVYDSLGDNAAGAVPDPELEPDMLIARLTSFRAEGPLFYGTAACYGYAKAAALLLSLEGFSVTRVVTREEGITGRTVFRKKLLGGYEEAIEGHSYLYVRLPDGDRIFDGAYSWAGTVTYGTLSYAWYRDLCAAVTLTEHRQIYATLQPDLYALSGEYRPAGNAYLPGVTFDGGRGMILHSREDLSAAFAALREEAARSEERTFTTCLLLSAEAFTRQTVLAEASSFCSGFSRLYYRSISERVLGGETVYCLILSFQKP